MGQAILVAEDCGVHEALAWLAREFLALNLHFGGRDQPGRNISSDGSGDIEDGESGNLLSEIKRQFVVSSLYSDLSLNRALVGSNLLDPEGIPKDLPKERQVALAAQVRSHPPRPLYCLLRFSGRVKLHLDLNLPLRFMTNSLC